MSRALRALRAARRWPIVIGIVVVVAGGGSAAWALTRSSGGTDATSQVVTAAVHTVTQTVSASGTIASAHEADLDFAASGRVDAVKVEPGDHVTKGQSLATLGTAALAAQQAAAQASVAAAEDKVAADGSATAVDKAALQAARSELTSAGHALTAATLTSTITGTVTAVNLSVGQQVSTGASAASSGSASGSAQVVVQSAKSFLVNATVDDTEVDQVKHGQSVTITPEGATSPVTGTVRSVGKVPTSSSGVVSFPVVVRVTGHPSGVYAGASATLSITTKQVPHVLEIPALAVRYDGSTATVRLQQGGSTVTRTITVGQTYGAEVQVLSGLSAGDKVVVTLPTLARFTPGGRNGNGNGNGTFRLPGGGVFNQGTGPFGGSGKGGFPSDNFGFGNGNG